MAVTLLTLLATATDRTSLAFAEAPIPPPATRTPSTAPVTTARPSSESGVDIKTSANAPRTELPPDIETDVAMKVTVPSDKHVIVIHTATENQRPIVYLHNIYSNLHAVESWKQTTATHGTLIELVNDRPCDDGRFK